MTRKEKFDLVLQRWAPHHLVSTFWGIVAKSRVPFFKNYLIRKFIRRFKVNMDESIKTVKEFSNFNEFFTRRLKPETRPRNQEPKAMASPCDGTVLEAGFLSPSCVLHAKGQPFDLKNLLGPGNESILEPCSQGHYATIYLSPKDYHRVHIPYTGRLEKTTYIPGKLFSVSPFVVKNIPQVFARNERLICQFATDQGPMILIFVGAIIVSGIKTVWGDKSKLYSSSVRVGNYAPHGPLFQKGQEIGHFEVGSTVILLCPWKDFQFELTANQPLKLGEKIGGIIPALSTQPN